MHNYNYRQIVEQISYLEEIKDSLIEQKAREMFPNYDSLPKEGEYELTQQTAWWEAEEALDV